MTHLFRPVDPPENPSPPVGPQLVKKLAVAVALALALVKRLIGSHQSQRLMRTSLILVGLVVQMVLLLTVAYMVDLSLSLIELWADLARKHLEITM